MNGLFTLMGEAKLQHAYKPPLVAIASLFGLKSFTNYLFAAPTYLLCIFILIF